MHCMRSYMQRLCAMLRHLRSAATSTGYIRQPLSQPPQEPLTRGVASFEKIQNWGSLLVLPSRLLIPPLGNLESCSYSGFHRPFSSSTTSSLGMFPYQKLDTDTTIRLIQVLPDLEDGKIVCELRIVDIEASPDFEYHALSYVWGRATPRREIFLQDMKTKQRYLQRLHENLWQFLYQIQEENRAEYEARPKNTSQLPIWTDALCLNQEDDHEKAQQIPRMGAIYSQAKIVLVWLGSEKGLQSELECLRDCGDNVGFYDALGVPSYNATGYYSSTELGKNPYWKRIWVVQEIVLAPRARVMAGNITMEFSRLERQLMLNDDTRGLYQESSTAGHNWLTQIINFRAAERGNRMPLWRIVQYLWDNQKSRAADGIYGILGLVGNHSDGTSPKEHIAVNYDKSAVDVFFDTIFETRAPLNEYPKLLQDLNFILGDNCANRPFDTHFPLEKYLKGKTISDRHRNLATTASKVNDAMRMLPMDITVWLQTSPHDPSFSFRASHIFDHSSIQPDADKFTLVHHAAVIGFLLGFVRGDPGWDKNHWLKRPSPWRCAVHRAQQQYSIPACIIGLWKANFYLSISTDLVAVCREKCESCDVSQLVFEMPEVGFSLQIDVGESDSPEWKDGKLSIGLSDAVSYDNR